MEVFEACTIAPAEKARLLADAWGCPNDVRGIEMGWAAGYPECCILFFVKFWTPLFLAEFLMRDPTAKAAIDSYREMMDRDQVWPFIPCPACLLKGGA